MWNLYKLEINSYFIKFYFLLFILVKLTSLPSFNTTSIKVVLHFIEILRHQNERQIYFVHKLFCSKDDTVSRQNPIYTSK